MANGNTGKKHSEETKKKMSKNHADFRGDKNPFKKSLADPDKLEKHKNRCQKIWDSRDSEYRKKFGRKIQEGYGEISGTFWARIKSNAKAKNREFEITLKDCWAMFIQQNKKCKLSGLEITFSSNPKQCTASLDRIDNSIGYITENVQWVHKTINLMKRTLSDKEFIWFCNEVAKNDPIPSYQ